MRYHVNENVVFTKGTPTAFIVCSPLQLLCAIEFDLEFEIRDKKYVIVTDPGCPRNSQLLAMAEEFHLDFEEVSIDELNDVAMYNHTGFFQDYEQCAKYGRVIVGEYFDYYMLRAVYKYAQKDAYVLYTDDGNSSIPLFLNKSDVLRSNLIRKEVTWYLFKRNYKFKKRQGVVNFLQNNGIICTDCFFTLYSDIKSSKYTVYPNTLNNVRRTIHKNDNKRMVLILGSMFQRLYDLNHIKEDETEAIYWRKLVEVKEEYPNEKIVFVPHGRDTNTNIPKFCAMLDIEYRKIQEAVEWYIIRSGIQPIAVYGQGSTALGTLKMLYPEAKVVNWFINKEYDNPDYCTEKRISRYYKQHGIIEDRINFPRQTSEEKIQILRENITDIKEWLHGKFFKNRK